MVVIRWTFCDGDMLTFCGGNKVDFLLWEQCGLFVVVIRWTFCDRDRWTFCGGNKVDVLLWDFFVVDFLGWEYMDFMW